MSSIDKYVEGEAQKCDSRVNVTNYNGTITGTVNGEVVFRISDRYGFLNENERNTIQRGIADFQRREEERRRREEAERRERERRERERRENERKAAKAAAESAVTSSLARLERAYAAAKRSAEEVAEKYVFSAELSKIQGFNLQKYVQKAQSLERKIASGVSALSGVRDNKKAEINRISGRLSGCSAAEDYRAVTAAINGVKVDVISADLCVSEAESFKAEVAQLNKILAQLNTLREKLSAINQFGAAGVIAQNMLNAIRNTEIAAIADVQSIVQTVQEQFVAIHNLQYQERAKGNADEAAALSGAIDACTQLAEIAHVSSFAPKRHDEEVLKTAQRVYASFRALDEAEYTTCTVERRMQVFEKVQAVIMGADGEESTLQALKKLVEEGEVYARNDRLLKDKFEEYKKMYQELEELGGDVSKVERFDANDYENQKKKLNAMLLEMDLAAARSQGAMAYAAACAAMEEQGYQMLRCNMSQNGLAFEAVYAIPRAGREGAVCHLIVSDGNIRRRICGVARTDGTKTSEQAVLQAATDAENSGEIGDFFARYRKYGGGVSKIVSAIDADSENALEAIRNGYIQLDEREEQILDKVTAAIQPQQSAAGGAAQTKKSGWTYVPREASFKCGGSGEMERQADRCQQAYQQKRAQ